MWVKFFKKVAIGAAVAAFWIAVWWGIALLVGKEVLVPTPWRVLEASAALITTVSFWQAVGLTLLRILLGFTIALAVGTVMAVLTVRFRLVRALFAPLLRIIRAAPVASFIIFALVWIATDATPVFITFLTVLPIVWVNMEEGLLGIDPQLKEVAAVYRLGWWKRLTQLTVPSVMPFFATAAVNGLGFAWKSGVAAEVICQPQFSVGRGLFAAKITFEMPDSFAWTAVVILLSMLLEWTLVKLIHKVPTYRKGDSHADAE